MRHLAIIFLLALAGIHTTASAVTYSVGRNQSSRKASTPGRTRMATPASSATREDTSPKAIFDWPTGRKLVALTFDDGPNARYTPALVSLLEKKRAKATFFVQGEMLRAFPSTAGEEVNPLFEIGNHGYDHKQFTKLSDDGIVSQLSRTEELITSVTGHRSVLVRPPYGAADSRVRRICAKHGYHVIMWDIDTNDWRGRSVQNMRDNILKNVRDGSIILMHDHFKTSHETTAIVIDDLRARGFEFVKVSEMLSFPHKESANSSQTTSNPIRSEGASGGSER